MPELRGISQAARLRPSLVQPLETSTFGPSVVASGTGRYEPPAPATLASGPRLGSVLSSSPPPHQGVHVSFHTLPLILVSWRYQFPLLQTHHDDHARCLTFSDALTTDQREISVFRAVVHSTLRRLHSSATFPASSYILPYLNTRFLANP